jgi:hypothetical protein
VTQITVRPVTVKQRMAVCVPVWEEAQGAGRWLPQPAEQEGHVPGETACSDCEVSGEWDTRTTELQWIVFYIVNCVYCYVPF